MIVTAGVTAGMLTTAARREVFRGVYVRLIGAGMPGTGIAGQLGISVKSVYEDVRALGLVLPVNVPCAAAVAASTEAKRARVAARIARQVRTCPKCELELPFGAFGSSASTADGRYPWCKECTARVRREERAAKRARVAVQAQLAAAVAAVAGARARPEQRCRLCRSVKLASALTPEGSCFTCQEARGKIAERSPASLWTRKPVSPPPEQQIAAGRAQLAQAAAAGFGERIYRLARVQPPPAERWCCSSEPGSAHEGGCPVRMTT